jgi:2-dehydro-3-deoxyphosphooctonate aldolase (KDO 8-P synthase)
VLRRVPRAPVTVISAAVVELGSVITRNEPFSDFFVIAGPCVVESLDLALRTGDVLAEMAERLGISFVYKSSFDKANRSAEGSQRGPGLEEGLSILARVKAETGLSILTDVHETVQVSAAAEVADVIQIPAFLARQTDLLQAAAATGCYVNIKKGQFMAPADMHNAIGKAAAALPSGSNIQDKVWLCERGTSFGYHDLVVDMRGLSIMRETGCKVIFDASHSVQRPSGMGNRSGGDREAIPALARAAVAVGIDGLFIETHPEPENAHSDAATVWPLDRLEGLLRNLLSIDQLVKTQLV